MAGWWRRWLGRRWGEDLSTLRSRYERFQHLTDGNNRVLELMADAGDKSGGDYLFDRRYLDSLVDDLEEAVSGVVYDLNAMTDGRYIDLVDAFERVRARVRSVLAPGTEWETDSIIPLSKIDLDDLASVGEKMASLGELRSRLDVGVPDGFVVTASACRRHFRARGLDRVIAARAEELASGTASLVDIVAADLQQSIRRTPIVRSVARSLRKEIGRSERSGWTYAARSSALGEDGEHSFAGQHATLLNVRAEDAVAAYREVLASLFSSEALRYRLDRGLSVAEALMAVGFMAMVPARVSGVILTIDPASPQRDIMVVSAAYGLGPTIVQGTGPTDCFEISRDPSPRVVGRKILQKELALQPRQNGGIERITVETAKQAAACVSESELTELGRMALRIERHAGHYQEIEWAVDQEGRIVILQARALRVSPSGVPADEELVRIRAACPVLLRGRGVIACRGVGAGPVVVVRSTEDMPDFPQGGVLVTTGTSPQYSAMLARATAVVAEMGSSTGHLATVARELRVPMLVDVHEATKVLQPGMEVTVDAEENVVYSGVVRELLRYHLTAQPADADFTEFQLLRRLLRRITPLNLSDPNAENFRARSCSTYHDVIRFAHEMAVRELGEMPGLAAGERKRFVRRLQLSIPMDLDILDIGGGIAPGVEGSSVVPEDVRSVPLSALLAGLSTPGTWRTEPVDMDMKSFLSSATRTAAVGMTDAGAVRPNLAVIAKDYLNLHLLLGYHFNMVDCNLSETPTANYLYFRFVGGVTDITRRSRRARVIAAILQEYEFGVETKGDLVVGRLRNMAKEPLRQRLEMVGRLIGYTRQLDVLMRDEETVRECAQEFVEREQLSVNKTPIVENADGVR